MASEGMHEEKQIPDDIEHLLKEYPELRIDRQRHKICCCLTGHEMPAGKEVILSYVKGKKFLQAQREREYDYDAHKPHLVPGNKKRCSNQLFCMLTLRHVTRRPADVERHVTGKRYRRALERWKKCQETGETFRPRAKKRPASESDEVNQHQKAEFWQVDSDSEGNQLEDDMSDLYPEKDFMSEVEEAKKKADNTSDSDFDFDAMEAPVSSESSLTGNPSGSKEKAPVTKKLKRDRGHAEVQNKTVKQKP